MHGNVIAQVSTPPGKGRVAVIRMSGEGSLDIAKKVFLPFEKRSLSIQKGTLTDTFPAYGVHVYKITLP